jgi:hypothetical protein
MLSRRLPVALLGLAFLAGPAVSIATAEDRLVTNIRVDNGGAPYAGDATRVTTISPNRDGLRDRAHIRFDLKAAATIRLDVATVRIRPTSIYTSTRHFNGGSAAFTWAPPPATTPRTYLVLLAVVNANGSLRRFGALKARNASLRDTPIVRVQGVDAFFNRSTYRAGAAARLTVAADARSLHWQILRAGVEQTPTRSDDDFHGRGIGLVHSVRVTSSNTPFSIRVSTAGLRTGVYFVRLTALDGRHGYAPFIITPRHLGSNRVAVVLPTYTWQAYNFEDADQDGWGDTWYAGWFAHTARLGRHFAGWGMPPYFRRYELPYLTWLARHRHAVDFLSDDELQGVSGRRLAHAYDLLVFPSHHEYVTQSEYDTITFFRNRGGNLMFLSANNFFWKVTVRSGVLTRTAEWRTLGRPEAALLGTQYRANDHGTHKGAWIVEHASLARWLWRDTGLRNGAAFGRGGIEIDSRTHASPAGTIVVAEIPHLYGPQFDAQMTYYETKRGARVFSAGAMMLTKPARYPRMSRFLENLWQRMAAP